MKTTLERQLEHAYIILSPLFSPLLRDLHLIFLTLYIGIVILFPKPEILFVSGNPSGRDTFNAFLKVSNSLSKE